MGHRSCSLRPESARGRVMMALPVDVAGLCPRSGDVGAPPKPRSSLSSVAEAEPEPEPLGRARRRSFGRGQDGVRALGSGEAEFRRLLGLSPSPSPGSGGAEFPMTPLAGPDCLSVSLCQVALQSEWRKRRCPFVRPVSGAAK